MNDDIRQEGIVKFFATDRGYGFIEPNNGGPDVFVHYTGIKSQDNFNSYRKLEEGDRVLYKTTMSEKGLAAVEVEIL